MKHFTTLMFVIATTCNAYIVGAEKSPNLLHTVLFFIGPIMVTWIVALVNREER